MLSLLLRDQDLADALDSGGSDMEMERSTIQVQEQSTEHRAKMWKVREAVRLSVRLWFQTFNRHVQHSLFVCGQKSRILVLKCQQT